PAGHPEPPRVVDDDQVDPPGLFALGGQAGTRATADDRLAALDLLPQPLQQRSPVLHAHLRFPQQISWNAATAAAANSGSLMLCGTRWRRRFRFAAPAPPGFGRAPRPLPGRGRAGPARPAGTLLPRAAGSAPARGRS